MRIEDIPGYRTVSDVVTPDGWVKRGDIWSLVVEPVLSEDGDFIRRLTLVMVDDWRNPTGVAVEIRCGCRHINRRLPTGSQITGLAIRFRDMVKEAGWEQSFWELYDFEQNEIDLRCDEISLRRIESKDLMTRMHEMR
jgi:hypothetical protein